MTHKYEVSNEAALDAWSEIDDVDYTASTKQQQTEAKLAITTTHFISHTVFSDNDVPAVCVCGEPVKKPASQLLKELQSFVATQRGQKVPDFQLRARLLSLVPACSTGHTVAALFIALDVDTQRGKPMKTDELLADIAKLRKTNKGMACEDGCFTCGSHSRSGQNPGLVSTASRIVESKKRKDGSVKQHTLRFAVVAETRGSLNPTQYAELFQQLSINRGASGHNLSLETLVEDAERLTRKVEKTTKTSSASTELEGKSRDEAEGLMREKSAAYIRHKKSTDHSDYSYYSFPDVDMVADAIAETVGQRAGVQHELAFKIVVELMGSHAGMGRTNTLLGVSFLSDTFSVGASQVKRALKILRNECGVIWIAKQGAPGKLPEYRLNQQFEDKDLSRYIAGIAREQGIANNRDRGVDYDYMTGNVYEIDAASGARVAMLGNYGKGKQKFQRAFLTHGPVFGMCEGLEQFVDQYGVSADASTCSDTKSLEVVLNGEQHTVQAPIVESGTLGLSKVEHKLSKPKVKSLDRRLLFPNAVKTENADTDLSGVDEKTLELAKEHERVNAAANTPAKLAAISPNAEILAKVNACSKKMERVLAKINELNARIAEESARYSEVKELFGQNHSMVIGTKNDIERLEAEKAKIVSVGLSLKSQFKEAKGKLKTNARI